MRRLVVVICALMCALSLTACEGDILGQYGGGIHDNMEELQEGFDKLQDFAQDAKDAYNKIEGALNNGN